MGRMTKEEKLEWDELYEYVKYSILNYSKEKNLPKNLVLRLKGLRYGKFMANNKTKNQGDYSFKLILLTFKANKFNIINSIGDKSKFKNETHMINYIMTIVENNINDMFDVINNKRKADEKAENIVINNVDMHTTYISKTLENKNEKLKSLW